MHGGVPQTAADLDVPADAPSARLIDTGAHPDLCLLTRGFNEKTGKKRNDITIDDVRAMQERFAQTAAMDGWRVCLIDSIDDMNNNSINSLLKILEEPNEQTIFFIVCHNPGLVPPTIHSRCRTLAFRKLPPETLRDIIGAHLARTEAEISEESIAAAAFLADGSAGRAVQILETDGLALYQEMLGLLAGLPRLDGEALHKLSDRFIAQNATPEQFDMFCHLLTGWLHRLIGAKVAGRVFAPVYEQETELPARMAADPIRYVGLWEHITQSAHETRRLGLDKKQAVLDWFARAADIAREAA